jgi:hypothetical protein
MTALITGNFQDTTYATGVLAELYHAGFSRAQLSSMPVHESIPQAASQISHSSDEDAGAENAGVGAASGAAIGGAFGLAAGLATFPALGPGAMVVGAAGAYAGSLVGALNALGDESTADAQAAPDIVERLEPRRRAGTWVVIAAATASEQATAIGILRAHRATDIERTEGDFAGGRWHDFDALAPLKLLVD